MPRLTTTLAAAGLATVIASTVLTSLAGAADDCLSGPVPADAAPRGSPAIARREPAEPLPAYDSSGPTFRLALSLLLVATGLGAVTGAVVFRRSGPLLARLNGDPFHGRSMESAQCLDEMTPEEMTSLALARDLPLFLVRGRIGAD